MLGRGPRVPKRLIETRVGSVVSEVMPNAVLWASTFRPADGLGVRPTKELLLLQCSPAERRTWGLSTRINRRTLHTYIQSPHLRAWGDHAQFILASYPEDVAGAELLVKPVLWAISAQKLADFTDKQGRGTVNQEGLEQLISERSACPLGRFLEQWEAGTPPLQTVGEVPPRPGLEDSEDSGFFRFDLNAPTPLGLALGSFRNV
jgi:hypothetical protein